MRTFVSSALNSPIPGSGICFSYRTDSQNYGAQLVLSDRGIHYRGYSGAAFGDWVKVATA